MPIPEIEEFAKILVQQVRDEAVRSIDMALDPDSESVLARRWRKSGASLEAIAMAVPDVVDSALMHLLHLIDEGLLRLQLVSSGGRTVDLTEEGHGELTGWFLGSDGWVGKYARERFIDDLAYLDKWPPPSPED
jgi:hypothetical protein